MRVAGSVRLVFPWDSILGLAGLGMGIWEDERTDYFSLAFFSFSRTSVLDALRLSSQPLSSPTPTPFPFHPSSRSRSRSRSPHFTSRTIAASPKNAHFLFLCFPPFVFHRFPITAASLQACFPALRFRFCFCLLHSYLKTYVLLFALCPPFFVLLCFYNLLFFCSLSTSLYISFY